jgi:hypothetical protein
VEVPCAFVPLLILCVFARLDLCGEEVLPDYPHNEVRNYGVNHFPEGVFQKCRNIIQKEKEAERERLKKAKRSKGNKKNASVGPAVVNMDAWDDEGVVNTNANMNGGSASVAGAATGNGNGNGNGNGISIRADTIEAPIVPATPTAVPVDPWEAAEAASNINSNPRASATGAAATPPPTGSPVRTRPRGGSNATASNTPNANVNASPSRQRRNNSNTNR